MSVYDQGAAQEETRRQQEGGVEAFLSNEERRQVARILGFPENFPKAFGAWLSDYIAVNGLEIPISQIRGANQFRALVAEGVSGEETTTSAAYVSLATGGPTLSGIGKGQYLFFHGCTLRVDAAGDEARQTIQFNDETAVSDNACFSALTEYTSPMRVIPRTFDDFNNTVTCTSLVEGGGTGRFQLRWLIGLKYAN